MFMYWGFMYVDRVSGGRSICDVNMNLYTMRMRNGWNLPNAISIPVESPGAVEDPMLKDMLLLLI